MSSIEERVAAGAAWLDEHEPGWIDKVNTDDLAMRDCRFCIVGQVFGDFDRLFDTNRSGAVAGGFALPYETPAEAWDELAAEWRRIILDRRAVTADA